MKVYLEFPFKHRWTGKPSYKFLPLFIGINFSWQQVEFTMYPGDKMQAYYPKQKEFKGKQYFAIRMFFMYWNIAIYFYTPTV